MIWDSVNLVLELAILEQEQEDITSKEERVASVISAKASSTISTKV
jgi:hypothetical protein